MIAKQRRAHFVIWIGLGVLLLFGFAAAIAVKPAGIQKAGARP